MNPTASTWRLALLLALAQIALLAAAGPLAAQPAGAERAVSEAYRSEVAGRRAFIISTYARAANVTTHPKWYPYYVLAATASRGCGDGKLAAYMTSMRDVADPAAPGTNAPELFGEPPFIRYLYRFRSCLTDPQVAQIRTIAEKPKRLFEHGTLNMASATSTSIYLLAQFFPQTVFTDANGGRRYGSGEIMRLYKALMVRRYRKMLRDGDAEMLSPIYAQVSMYAALNLVEFAQDPDLRAYAEAYLVQSLAILKASSFQGVILAPLYRQNAQQRSGPASAPRPCVSSTQHAMWVYFGEPEIGPWDLESSCEPTYATMFAVSEWLPPETLARFPEPQRVPTTHQVTIPTFSHWDGPTRPMLLGTVYRSRHFAIGSGNTIFEPRGYHSRDSTFTLAFDKKGEYDAIECFHPYWMSNAGIGAWSTMRVPPTFSPNATSRSSPFQQSYFHRGRGVLLFSIPETDPWPGSDDPRIFADRDRQKDALFVRQNCHFPRRVDEYRVEGSWTFIRAGGTFVGIETVGQVPKILDGPTEPAFKEFIDLITEARHAAIFVVAEDADKAGSFEAFRSRAKAVPRHHDPARDVFRFQDEDGREAEVTFRLEPEPGSNRMRGLPAVTVNGTPWTPRSDAPLVGEGYGFGGGRLHIETAGSTLEVVMPEGRPPEIHERRRPN